MKAVKLSTRKYDSSARKQKASLSRSTVLDAAERLFIKNGYERTTVATIAREAGISSETIYKTFGGKPGLVRAIYDLRLGGKGEVHAYQRSDEMRERESDPKVILRNWAGLTTEVASVLTPIRLLIRSAAASDDEMDALLSQNNADRMKRMRHHARFLAERAYLREGISVAKAADILWFCSSTELYEMLVLHRAWSNKRFAEFLSDFMINSLLRRTSIE